MVPTGKSLLTNEAARDGSANAGARIISAATSAADVDSKISIAVFKHEKKEISKGAASAISTAAYESSWWPNIRYSLFGIELTKVKIGTWPPQHQERSRTVKTKWKKVTPYRNCSFWLKSHYW